MVSAPTTLLPPHTPTTALHRSRSRSLPRSLSEARAARWLVRVGYALPLCVVAVWAHHRGFASSAQQLLQDRADAARHGDAALDGLRFAYPPLPTLLAAILPGGTLGVALCAAFVCGTAMESIAHRLLVRGMRTLVAGLLVASVIGIPAVCFEATQNLAGFAALAFLVLALDGFVRFAVRGDTLGGFAAGLLLAAAFLCDPVALVYALALGIAAPLLAADRFRREPTAARATALVLTFPTIATAGAWMFLEWRFTGGVFAALRADHQVLVFPRGAVNELGHAARDTGAVLLRSPLYLVIAAVMTRRRHPALAAYLVPVPALVVATWLGMWPSAALSFALFGMVALASAPRPTRHLVPLLVAAAIAQIAVAGAWAPAGVEFHSWVASLH